MSSLVKEKVILLKKIKYGEADLILHGLSSTEGKISFLARGALRSKKRFGGGILEPTHHIEAHFKRHSNPDRLCTLEEAILLNDFAKIRTSYERLEAALKVVEIASRASQPGDPHSLAVYNLVGSALKVLAADPSIPHFRMHFCIRFLRLQGVLEEDAWMSSFLQVPMAESVKINQEPIDADRLLWIETHLDKYLTRAES